MRHDHKHKVGHGHNGNGHSAERTAETESAKRGDRPGGGGNPSHGGHPAGGITMDWMPHAGDLKRRFWVSLALAVPIMMLSPIIEITLPFQTGFPGSEWVVTALACALYFYGGKPFLLGARDEIKRRAPAIMTLVTLGITVALAYSLYAFLMNDVIHSDLHVMDFFWELAALIVIILLGYWIGMQAVMGTENTLNFLLELLPASTQVVGADGNPSSVTLRELRIGHTVLVDAWEKVPADGVIIKGRTEMNEAMVTGESRGVEKAEGDAVIGGSLNGSGIVTVRITATGEEGYVARASKLIADGRKNKSREEILAGKAAKWLFYVTLAAGAAAFAVWLLLTKDLHLALSRMLTVLVIACPHALGLAIPLVSVRSAYIGAEHGLLVRNRQAIEKAGKLDMVMVDKTGILTEGRFELRDIQAFGQESENSVLAIAAALERGSSHPVAVGILRAAQERKLFLPIISDVRSISGAGVEGVLMDGRKTMLVSARYLAEKGMDFDRSVVEMMAEDGCTVSVLTVDGDPVGAIAQGDRIKPGAAETVRRLKAQGIRPVMLTGDGEKAAEAVARKLGIEEFHALMCPEDKAEFIKRIRSKGITVMMVGNGVNDAPSLAAADIGVAIGAGADVEIYPSDVILVKSDPRDILNFISLAGATRRKIQQNLCWCVGYNIVAIPLARGIMAPAGFQLGPAAGAILMCLSTIIVAVNATLLRLPREE